jgi:hypothetical protein
MVIEKAARKGTASQGDEYTKQFSRVFFETQDHFLKAPVIDTAAGHAVQGHILSCTMRAATINDGIDTDIASTARTGVPRRTTQNVFPAD